MTPELEALNQKTRDGLRRAREELERLLEEQLIIDTARAIEVAVDQIKLAEQKHRERPIVCELCGDLCKPDESPKS